MVDVKYWSIIILISIFILIGLVGNLINLIVFSHKTMIKNSTFKYLFYLSIIDMLVLAFCASDSFLTFAYYIQIRLKSEVMCRFHTFLTYFLTHMSSIVLMVVSIDRTILICVCKPEKFPYYKYLKNQLDQITKMFKNVNQVILGLIIFTFLINIHFIFFLNINNTGDIIGNLNKTFYEYGNNSLQSTLDSYNEARQNLTISVDELAKALANIQPKMCFPKPNEFYYHFLSDIWTWIDALIYSLIPFVVMLICSIIIVKEVRQKSNALNLNNRNSKSVNRNRQLLVMLTITNFYFILCSLPLCISLIYYKYTSTAYEEQNSFQAYFHILAYSNNSINFIFYFCFSNNYKQVVLKYFRLDRNNENINRR